MGRKLAVAAAGLAIAAVVLWRLVPTAPAEPLDAHGDPLPRHALMRLGTVRFTTLAQTVSHIEYSADGKYLATAATYEYGSDRSLVEVFERSTGRNVTPPKMKTVEASGLSWAPDGRRLATSHPLGSEIGSLLLWTIGSDEPVVLDRKEGWSAVDWSPTGDRIAARSRDGEVALFDPQGIVTLRFAFTGEARTMHSAKVIDFFPDGRRIAVVSEAGLRIHDADSGSVESELPVASEKIRAVQVLDGGGSVALATSDKIEIHRLGAPPEPVRAFGKGGYVTMAVSPDGRWVAGSDAQSIKVWELATGEAVDAGNTSEFGFAFSPDGSELALATRRLSFVKTGDWKPDPAPATPSRYLVRGVLDGDRLWTVESWSKVIEWDLTSGQALSAIHRGKGTSTFAVLDGGLLALNADERAIEIVDGTSRDVVMRFPAHSEWCRALVWSSRHQRLISAGNDAIRGWNVANGARVLDIPHNSDDHHSQVSLGVSPDGELFAAARSRTYGSGDLRVFRVEDGAPLWEQGQVSPFCRPAFTADSSTLVSSVDSIEERPCELVFSEARTGIEKRRLRTHSGTIFAFALSPNGRYAAVSLQPREKGKSGGDKLIQLWSLDDDSLITSFEGHLDSCLWLAFTEDSRRLISVSQDATALVWDVDAVTKNRK